MAKRGPKPKPTTLKLIEGTRADRVNRDEPRPALASPNIEPPENLDGPALDEWRRMSRILSDMRVMTVADAAALRLYCEAYALHREATEAVRDQGMVTIAGSGGLKTNPHVTIANQARAIMLKILSEFGCTPSSRSRVQALPNHDQVDPLDALINKHKHAAG